MSLDSLFQSGHIAVVIVVIMLAEAVFFGRLFRRYPGIFSGLAAGACLALALRAALLQQGSASIALFLFFSFMFHVLEIRQWLRLARQT